MVWVSFWADTEETSFWQGWVDPHLPHRQAWCWSLVSRSLLEGLISGDVCISYSCVLPWKTCCSTCPLWECRTRQQGLNLLHRNSFLEDLPDSQHTWAERFWEKQMKCTRSACRSIFFHLKLAIILHRIRKISWFPAEVPTVQKKTNLVIYTARKRLTKGFPDREKDLGKGPSGGVGWALQELSFIWRCSTVRCGSILWQ